MLTHAIWLCFCRSRSKSASSGPGTERAAGMIRPGHLAVYVSGLLDRRFDFADQPARTVDFPSFTKRSAASAIDMRSKASSSAIGRSTRWSNSVDPSGAGEG